MEHGEINHFLLLFPFRRPSTGNNYLVPVTWLVFLLSNHFPAPLAQVLLYVCPSLPRSGLKIWMLMLRVDYTPPHTSHITLLWDHGNPLKGGSALSHSPSTINHHYYCDLAETSPQYPELTETGLQQHEHITESSECETNCHGKGEWKGCPFYSFLWLSNFAHIKSSSHPSRVNSTKKERKRTRRVNWVGVSLDRRGEEI